MENIKTEETKTDVVNIELEGNIACIIINSLDQYIKMIDLLPSEVRYFRGENALYKEQVSSAFRTDFESTQGVTAYPWQEMIKNFYNEVAYKLAPQEKISFIAFAQHYGIPTNLIDITASPLVALFFACQPNKRQESRAKRDGDKLRVQREHQLESPEYWDEYYSNYGYVYFYDNFLDVTELINKLDGKNFIEYYFLNSDTERLQILPYIQTFKRQNPAQFKLLWGELHRIVDLVVGDHFDDRRINRLMYKLFCDRAKLNMQEIFGALKSRYPELAKQKKIYDIDVLVYIMTISLYIHLEKNVYGDDEEYIPYMPNFLYSPVVEFERGRNQQGKFLYQAYFSYNNDVLDLVGEEGFNDFALQEIQPASIYFKIIKKGDILLSLDKIGINEKTVWCDFDNIASYIKKNAKGSIHV